MDNAPAIEQIVDTREIHARINPCLPDAVPPEALGDRSASKGRTPAMSRGRKGSRAASRRRRWRGTRRRGLPVHDTL
jgi:hypothetical protein